MNPTGAAEELRLAAMNARVARDFGHKVNATPETAAKADVAGERQGALARLYRSGSLSLDQLSWAMEIAEEHRRIGADVEVKGASLDARVDQCRLGEEAFFESLGRVWRAMAYTRWRRAVVEELGAPIAAVLAIIVDDCGVAAAAQRWRMSLRRCRKLLIDALDLWVHELTQARDEVDGEDLDRAYARLV